MPFGVDSEKAYDHASWSFLIYTVEGWASVRNRVNTYPNASQLSSLGHYLCGSSSFFQSSRDQHLGDPLSLSLFILAIDALNHLILKAKELGLIKGFLAVMNIIWWFNPFLWLQMTLLFFKLQKELTNFRCVLLYFQAVLGLKINYGKLKVVSISASAMLLVWLMVWVAKPVPSIKYLLLPQCQYQGFVFMGSYHA